MATDRLRYDKMVERALRGVVREAIEYVASHGLPGNHHFYLTFRTGHPGVELPEYLEAQYPDDMTIVLQHQFYGLEVEGDAFSVSLSFNNVQERLTVPFAAIVTFADPSVNFALQFQLVEPEESAQIEYLTAPGAAGRGEGSEAAAKSGKASGSAAPDGASGETAGKVVALDAFRKKS